MSAKRPALGFIFATLLIDIIGLGIIIPVMPQLIEELTGSNVSQAAAYSGWLLLAYAAMQFLCAPIVGGLSDRYGRRPVLLASLFGFGIDYTFLALAPSIGWLFIGRIIAGMMGASFTTASAYIADVSTPENRAQNFGIIGAAFGLGFIIGPMMEEYLRRALLLSRSDPMVFLSSPVSATMLTMSLVALALVMLPALRKKREEAFVE